MGCGWVRRGGVVFCEMGLGRVPAGEVEVAREGRAGHGGGAAESQSHRKRKQMHTVYYVG